MFHDFPAQLGCTRSPLVLQQLGGLILAERSQHIKTISEGGGFAEATTWQQDAPGRDEPPKLKWPQKFEKHLAHPGPSWPPSRVGLSFFHREQFQGGRTLPATTCM